MYISNSKKEKEKEKKEDQQQKNYKNTLGGDNTKMLTKNDKYNIKIIIIPHIITIPTSTTNIQIDHFKTTLHILNTLSNYKHIHCKTTFMCPGGKVHCGSAFESGASGSTHFFTPPVYVPDGIGAQTVWRHNNQKKKWVQGFLGFIQSFRSGFQTETETGLRVCHSFHGPLRECLRARYFRATLLLHLHLCAFLL